MLRRCIKRNDGLFFNGWIGDKPEWHDTQIITFPVTDINGTNYNYDFAFDDLQKLGFIIEPVILDFYINES